MTKPCKLTGSGNTEECDKAKFNATRCDYVRLFNKYYVCDEVKKNYTRLVQDSIEVVKKCSTVCKAPASGSFYKTLLTWKTNF